MGRLSASVHGARGFYLLASLVLLILVSPFLEGTRVGHFIGNALFSFVLLAAVNAASGNRRTQIVAFATAVLAILLFWTSTGDAAAPGRIAGMLLFVAVNVAAIVLLLRRLVLAPAVDFDVLCGAVALYLLLGVTWALTYMVMDTLNPSAFESLSITTETGWADFLYFSFTTLTTLGYGDISPSAAFARIWAVMEAAVGVLYLALLIARLVSLYRS